MEETKSAPIQIKHRWTGAVLYEGLSGMTMRETLEAATRSGSNLSGSKKRRPRYRSDPHSWRRIVNRLEEMR